MRACPDRSSPWSATPCRSSSSRPRGPARSDGSRHADLALTVTGVPLKLVGTIALSPTASGSTLVIDADLSCSIPLFGKKIEEAARPAIDDSIDHEVSQLGARLT
uniref:DUF2505 domain-containing protein n=1 Tax=Janibacter limosus TaxID=53458 RepID=A0AC61U8U8_9MICO|nr:DUF2505 domain-containing protein [Janibacter limosus]